MPSSENRRGVAWLEDNRRHPLSPPVIFDAGHRDFGNALALRNQALEFERHDPLAARLDHGLDSVGHLPMSLRNDALELVRVQVAALS